MSDVQRWRINKEISIGDLLAIVGSLAMIFTAYTTLDRRLSVIEDRQSGQQLVDKKQDDDFIRYQARIDQSLRDINDKLDRLLLDRAARGR